MESRADDADLTLLVVGAGAVENAWVPVLRALQHYYDFPLTSDGANSFLARIVYLLRWYATFPDPAAKERLVGFREIYADLCQRIRAELRAAQQIGELRVRPEFDAIVERFLIKRGTRFAVINTNWDTIVEEALTTRFQNRHGAVIEASHLHGSVWSDEPLYLPTEIAREPYRSADEHNLIGGLHSGAMEALGRARHVVLYGLSLCPLDAELCQTLDSGWSGSGVESVDIIVPDHEIVAHRVNLIVDPTRSVAIHGYHPGALDNAVDYTIPRRSNSSIHRADA